MRVPRQRVMPSSTVGRWVAGLLVVAVAMACGLGGPTVVEEPLSLVPGSRLSADLPPDHARRFTFELVGDELLAIGVEAGADAAVDVSLFDPEKRVTFEARAGGGEVVEVLAVAREAGRYALEVRPVDLERAASFELVVEERRSAEPGDRMRAEAASRLARAERLRDAGEREAAIEAYEAALRVGSGLPGRRRAEAAWRLGELLNEAGRPTEAIERLERARKGFAEESDALGEARVLLDLGDAQYAAGRIASAEPAYGRALELYREVEVRSGEATALHDLGLVAATLGDTGTAAARYREALALWEELESPAAAAVTLQGLGTLYSRIGRDAEAQLYLERALAAIGEGDPHARAVALTELGWLHHLRGESEHALTRLEEASGVAREAGNDFDEAAAEDRRGMVLADLGRRGEARRAYRRSLELSRRARARRTEAHTLTNLGLLELEAGEADRAVERLRRAAAVFRELGDQEVGTGIRAGLGRAERMRGNLDAARRELEAAVREIEERRGEVPGALSRSYYLAVRYDVFEELAAVLAEQDRRQPDRGFDREALRLAEAARSRGLVERLSARTGVGREDPRRRRLLDEIRELERRRYSGSPSDEEVQRIGDEILALWLRLEQLEPAPAAAPAPLDVDEMQAMLDGDTVLVVYLLGEPESLAWTVERGRVELHRLAGRELVERRARQAAAALREDGGDRLGTRTERVLEELSALVLQPLGDRLAGRLRLGVLADGALHLVPFAALPLDGGHPALVSMEVVNLPSASVLAWQREARELRRPPSELLAAIADPVMDAEDTRLTGEAREPAVTGDLQRALEDLDLKALRRLHGAKREVEAIAALAAPDRVMVATGFEANRELVIEGKLERFRIVHFATHGLVNPIHPGLSGIVLSLYDREGRARDGFVRAADVAELELQADLVVLSACRTATGPEVRGEGMVGLVDAMFAAGAQRVVASLWKVNDGPTSDLMEAFYEELLVHGRAPAAALRAAQLRMRNDGEERSFKDWAAFNLYGDWLPLSNLPVVERVGRSRADESEPRMAPGAAVEGMR